MAVYGHQMQPFHSPERFSIVMTSSNQTRADGFTALLFETWLQTDLQRLYDRTLDEPVPDELLRLIPQGQEPGSKQS